MNPFVIKLGARGPVLSTRERGRALADELEGALREGTGVVLSFEGVEIVTPSYLDEVLTRAAGILRMPGAGLFVAVGLDEEVRDTLEMVLEHRKLMLAALTASTSTCWAAHDSSRRPSARRRSCTSSRPATSPRSCSSSSRTCISA
jgi:hypothetical protein